MYVHSWIKLLNVFTEKRKVVDENMKKYNEDDVNYANSKQRIFKVGIM